MRQALSRAEIQFAESAFSMPGIAPRVTRPLGQPDRQRLGGGLALASPFGTFFPPNISPDLNDGIGRWRTIDLANALDERRFARAATPLSRAALHELRPYAGRGRQGT